MVMGAQATTTAPHEGRLAQRATLLAPVRTAAAAVAAGAAVAVARRRPSHRVATANHGHGRRLQPPPQPLVLVLVTVPALVPGLRLALELVQALVLWLGPVRVPVRVRVPLAPHRRAPVGGGPAAAGTSVGARAAQTPSEPQAASGNANHARVDGAVGTCGSVSGLGIVSTWKRCSAARRQGRRLNCRSGAHDCWLVFYVRLYV